MRRVEESEFILQGMKKATVSVASSTGISPCCKSVKSGSLDRNRTCI